MSKSQSLLSPKKADGTTDWDVVFDDQDRGLIPLIGRVRNVDALQECTMFMIKRLFTRKNDQLAVARFTKNLDGIISNAAAVGDLEAIKAEVVEMLLQIKSERVEKAREYIQQKNRKHKANRRTESAKSANTYRFMNHPRLVPIVIWSAVFLSAILIAFIFWLLDSGTKPTSAEQKAGVGMTELTEAERLQVEVAETKRKTQAEMAAKIAEATEHRDNKRKLIEEQKNNRIMPPALVMQGVFFQSPGSGKTNTLLPIFILDDREHLGSVCRARPVIVDAINVALSESGASGLKNQPLDLVGLANSVRKRVNSQFSKAYIEKIILVESAKHRDLAIAGNKCEYATDRYFDYIYPPESNK